MQLHDGIGRNVFPHVYVFRSAYIRPVEARKELTFGYRLFGTIGH